MGLISFTFIPQYDQFHRLWTLVRSIQSLLSRISITKHNQRHFKGAKLLSPSSSVGPHFPSIKPLFSSPLIHLHSVPSLHPPPGGGPSGACAAEVFAQEPNIETILFERKVSMRRRVGRRRKVGGRNGGGGCIGDVFENASNAPAFLTLFPFTSPPPYHPPPHSLTMPSPAVVPSLSA